MKIGEVNAERGEIKTGHVRVGESRDERSIELPIAIIRGRDDGDTLYLQAASDGDELNGLGVVHQLVRELNPWQLSGTIIIVGIVNPKGFRQNISHNPVDRTKINRVYPGSKSGSISERIAQKTFQIAKKSDLVLDFHQGVQWRMVNESRIRCGQNNDCYSACRELARVFGTQYVYDEKGSDGQLARVAPDAGIPAIDPELGGSVGWDRESIEIGLQGVLNVLKHYDFINGTCDVTSPTTVRSLKRYSSPVGGLVNPQVTLGERISTGDDLFDIRSVFGSKKATVTAEERGIAWAIRRLPQVGTGESVFVLGTDIA